jgi:hypothetical protein
MDSRTTKIQMTQTLDELFAIERSILAENTTGFGAQALRERVAIFEVISHRKSELNCVAD